VIRDGTPRVEAVEVVPAKQVEVQAGKQQEVEPSFTQPILLLRTGGHRAPIRSLVFTSDGSYLLSAGMDKIVNVWNLGEGGPALERTIRPPIWRGLTGTIFAMALSPTADDRGQRVLAVAGFGVAPLRGNIGLFYFPGSHAITTGDHFAQLLTDAPNDPGPSGHTSIVTSLAFNPRGTLLASGSGDATARIWDWKNRRTTAILRGHVGPINTLAFTPEGTHLITGGSDGTLRLWDIDRRAIVARAAYRPNPQNPRAGNPGGEAINALAVSPDGRYIVIGRENGHLVRYNAENLEGEAFLPTDANRQGPVEALAISPDGQRLATSIVSFGISRINERPRVECDLEVRAMPGGAVENNLARTSNLVYACAFTPDSRRLAYAGGDTQAITIRDLMNPNAPTVELAGQGSSLWDVGFSQDSSAIGFARKRPDLADPPTEYEGFDLSGRRLAPFAPGDLSRAVTTWNGWSFHPIDPHRIDVLNAQGQGFPLTLDRVLDRRWWSYSFIPPGPDHPRPLAAIGCESGVALFRLDNGQRTRFLVGHQGPVYCLAPSKDGRWLATGSLDQTVHLWTLAGYDVLPILGAEFRRLPDGARVVKSVERLGFAEAMGLKVGDVPTRFALGGKSVTAEDFFARCDSQLPNTSIELIVRRKVEPPKGPPTEVETPLRTTMRNGSALSLFLGEDMEWVLWMPNGYYDSSIAGDTKFLGWHLNQSPIFRPKPTLFLEMIKFEKSFHRPDLLDELLRSADPARSAATLERNVPRIAAEPHRLKALAIGIAEFARGAIPPVPFADRDASDLIALLVEKGVRLGFDQVTARVLAGADATALHIRDALATLDDESSGRPPRPGDAILVFLETRLRSDGRELALCGSDSIPGPDPGPIVPVAAVGDYLKRLALRGYQVLVFLDLPHEADPDGLDRPLVAWIRDLFREGVVVLIGSQGGLALRHDDSSHGAFAEALIKTLDKAVQDTPDPSSHTPLTLGGLATSIADEVMALTARRQQSGAYFGNLPAHTSVLDPASRERQLLAIPGGVER
jgi:WD40 repeat protein